MASGRVKWFNKAKGFGFIAPDEGGDDVFVHISALKQAGLFDLEEEQRVSFELTEAPNGRVSAGALELL